MQAFRFIHAADLHLDSPFLGLEHLEDSPPDIIQDLREATFRAFDNLIQLCLDKKVDFLLIAGDVYDGADRSLRAQLYFRDGLRKLSDVGIACYVIHGNHDPLNGWILDLQMPENAHVFGSEMESCVFVKNGEAVARIHGISYPKREIAPSFGLDFAREGDEPFQIGLFHCNVGGNKQHGDYAPRSIGQLVDANLDYWALGHIHKCEILSERAPFIAYSGNTQGRHINESGPKGCLLVDVSSAGELRDSPEFISLETVRWAGKKLEISDIEEFDDLLTTAEEMLSTLQEEADMKPVVTRVNLVGRTPLYPLLSRTDQQQDLLNRLREVGTSMAPFVWLQKLDFRFKPAIDLAKYRESNDFFGDLLKMIQEHRNNPETAVTLKKSLTELYQHGRAGRLLKDLNEHELVQLLGDVENQCVELLLEEE